MSQEDFTPHQQKIIKRYYDNIDTIALQRLADLREMGHLVPADLVLLDDRARNSYACDGREADGHARTEHRQPARARAGDGLLPPSKTVLAAGVTTARHGLKNSRTRAGSAGAAGGVRWGRGLGRVPCAGAAELGEGSLRGRRGAR